MTILSHLQEGAENNVYTSDSVNPVVTSAEFILKVSPKNGTFSVRLYYDTIKLSECRAGSNQ